MVADAFAPVSTSCVNRRLVSMDTRSERIISSLRLRHDSSNSLFARQRLSILQVFELCSQEREPEPELFPSSGPDDVQDRKGEYALTSFSPS